jgi:hypothetical protein
MTQTLTQLIASAQAQLLDDGTRFTTATLTAAARAALKDFNLYAPVNQSDLIDAVSAQYEYEITDTPALSITDILKYSADEKSTSITYDAYSEDERIFFRLRSPLADGEFILARYTIPYTVSGLDSETESTLSNLWDQVLIDGICFYACSFRAVSLAEDNNLNNNAQAGIAKAAQYFKAAFMAGLGQAARKTPPVSEPDTRAWNDQWVGIF